MPCFFLGITGHDRKSIKLQIPNSNYKYQRWIIFQIKYFDLRCGFECDLWWLTYNNRICQRQCFCPKNNSGLKCNMVLLYLRNLSWLILVRNCRYHSSAWRYRRLRSKVHNLKILKTVPNGPVLVKINNYYFIGYKQADIRPGRYHKEQLTILFPWIHWRQRKTKNRENN